MKNKRPQYWLLGVLAGTSLVTAEAVLSKLDVSYYSDYTARIWCHDQGAQTVLASAIEATWIGGDPLPVNHANAFTTFCLDYRYTLSHPAYWESGPFPNPNAGVQPTWQADGIYRAASLYREFAPRVNFTTSAGRLEGAALQLAIWEVLYETSGNHTLQQNAGDGFYVLFTSPALRLLANSMLASPANQVDSSLTSTFWNATFTADGCTPLEENQDLIGPPLPEAGTFIAGALLILPFLISTFRTRP